MTVANFAKVFGANVKHAFNEKVSNTIKARAQLHPLLTEQLVFLGFDIPEFAPVDTVFELHTDMQSDNGENYKKRQAKIITGLCNAIREVQGTGETFTLPQWTETKPRVQKETEETEESTPIDALDILGSVSKITDPEILEAIIAAAKHNLAMAQPATV
jgi:hypothetical protein